MFSVLTSAVFGFVQRNHCERSLREEINHWLAGHQLLSHSVSLR